MKRGCHSQLAEAAAMVMEAEAAAVAAVEVSVEEVSLAGSLDSQSTGQDRCLVLFRSNTRKTQ
jgi:hypothetical protein